MRLIKWREERRSRTVLKHGMRLQGAFTGLQGGAIMRGWMNDERVMIACCSDGTRPVIFKIERMDYKVLYIQGVSCKNCQGKIKAALLSIDKVRDVVFQDEFTEVYLDGDVEDKILKETVENCGDYTVVKID